MLDALNLGPLDDQDVAEEADSPEDLRTQIEETIAQLRGLSQIELSRLHEIEKMIVADVVKENRHLKCKGCLVWMTALLGKAKSS